MTSKDLSALGIHLDDLGRTPIGAPVSAPLVHIICAPKGRHVIRYADENTPAARRKPHGVKLFQLYAAVTKRGTADVRLAKHLGDFGRQPIRIAWSAAEAGLTASYFGRWMSAKGLKGPWSLPRSMVIVGGAAGGHCGDDDRLQLVQPRGVVTATASGVQRAA